MKMTSVENFNGSAEFRLKNFMGYQSSFAFMRFWMNREDLIGDFAT